MAFMQVEFFSEVLGLSSTIHVCVPQQLHQKSGLKVEPPYPVLYLLHGGSDNHTNWHRNSSIERYAADKGLVVVMPAVQFSYYSDQKYGFPYFTYVSEELPQIIRQFFHVSDQREDTFAAGFSMGGYGAFKLGITYPDKFAAVVSLSGSLDQRDRLRPTPSIMNKMMLQMAHYTFGSEEEYEGSENDLAWVLEQHLGDGIKLPKFYQVCGTNDHNYQINKEFFERFENRINVTYEEVPGRGHDWGFWDEYIQHALDWLPIRIGDAPCE